MKAVPKGRQHVACDGFGRPPVWPVHRADDFGAPHEEDFILAHDENLAVDVFCRVAAEEGRKRRKTSTARRSEEHTSELQSLMRISYAVFCLKKKTKTNLKTNTPTTDNDNK